MSEQLAEVSNGIVQIFSESYGRGPTKAKSYFLDETYVICVLEETMTTVERTLVETGKGDMVRQVRLAFQEALADEFKGIVSTALGRPVVGYHSQLTLDPDIGFEFFVLG